ncbi:Phosphoribosylformylglycinamidine synthase subunit PurQ [Candidatus Bilamarchaeum dharawalense]|uniref:Phosphoribosylformylglycinamidine synthase subunit PurQ n=1 Tax=Candidatus Bilamarchaeum dharawalense TaxID=2885759 RepID=A0A5E4LS41_9ARCH|nr:Phosphoribosylformylglycinamidine synthase subunit PurQ [Candidatus Bilamarchaeum dharawalense]
MALKALVVTGYGINCENESKYAIEKSGGTAEIVHVNKVLENPKMLGNYNMFFIPGGFAFGDDLGSGKVFGNKMKFKIKDQLDEFVKAGNLVVGICNGFQALVKMGLLPVPDFQQRVSLVGNDSGHFEDRWVILKTNKDSPCIYTKGMEHLLVPVRHGEGKFIPKNESILKEMRENNLVVFQYVDENGNLAGYPYNPNGSVDNIAALCDKTGRIFGMMPHPEAFNIPENCPYWIRGGIKEALGLRIFKNTVEFMR